MRSTAPRGLPRLRPSQRLELDARLALRSARRQSSEHGQPARSASAVFAERQRAHQGRVGERRPDILVEHSHDAHALTAHGHSTAEDAGIAAERGLPQAVADQDRVGPRPLVAGLEASAEAKAQPEGRQQVGCGVEHAHALGSRGALQVRLGFVEGGDMLQRRRAFAPVLVRRRRDAEAVPAAVGPRLPRQHQPVRLGKRQRPQQGRVQQAEDGDVRADARPSVRTTDAANAGRRARAWTARDRGPRERITPPKWTRACA